MPLLLYLSASWRTQTSKKNLLYGCLTLSLTNLYGEKVNFISQFSLDILNTLQYGPHLRIHMN